MTAEQRPCNGPIGFRIEFNLAGSDSMITDNAEKFWLDVCATERRQDQSFDFVSKATMVKGKDFGGKTGQATIDFINGQHWPILLAINQRMKALPVQRAHLKRAAREAIHDLKNATALLAPQSSSCQSAL